MFRETPCIKKFRQSHQGTENEFLFFYLERPRKEVSQNSQQQLQRETFETG